jgi:hypothetical protein
MSWDIVTAATLTEPLLRSVVDNQVAAVRIDGFASPERCNAAAQSLRSYDFTEINGVPKIGLSRTELWHLPDGEARYLAAVGKADAQRREILASSGDFLPEVLALFARAWPPGARVLTSEGDDRPYFAGILRSLKGNLLHVDWDPVDAPHWASGKVSAQLSWNLYLQTSETGGEVTLYRKLWQAADETHKRTDASYGYRDSVVAGCECARITPRTGQLVVFNTRNFHRVEPVRGASARFTITSAIGVLPPSGELVLWC